MNFKISRDLARLHTLMKDESNAYFYHERAEKLIREEVYPNIKSNIKMAKLQLLKGIWTAKFDYTKSTEEYIAAYHMLNELLETDANYFGANC